jgi:hypothetical protein
MKRRLGQVRQRQRCISAHLIKESNGRTGLSYRFWAGAISGRREHHQGGARRPIGCGSRSRHEAESQAHADSRIVEVASV